MCIHKVALCLYFLICSLGKGSPTPVPVEGRKLLKANGFGQVLPAQMRSMVFKVLHGQDEKLFQNVFLEWGFQERFLFFSASVGDLGYVYPPVCF